MFIVQILAHVSPSRKQLIKQDTSSEEKASKNIEVLANTNFLVLGKLLHSVHSLMLICSLFYIQNSATVTGGSRSSKSKRDLNHREMHQSVYTCFSLMYMAT